MMLCWSSSSSQRSRRLTRVTCSPSPLYAIQPVDAYTVLNISSPNICARVARAVRLIVQTCVVYIANAQPTETDIFKQKSDGIHQHEKINMYYSIQAEVCEAKFEF